MIHAMQDPEALEQHVLAQMAQAAASGPHPDMEDSTDSSDDETPAPFDVRPGQPSEPEQEPGTGPEESSAIGEIDYTVQVANDFSMAFDRNKTVLDLKMAVCHDMRHLQPGDLNVYHKRGTVSLA